MTDTRVSEGCLHICSKSVWKINVLHWKDRGKLLWGEYSTVVSRTWIIPIVLWSILLSFNAGAHLPPFTRCIISILQDFQQHCSALQCSHLVAGEAEVFQHCSAAHWLYKDTWSSHTAGLTCLACEIWCGPSLGWHDCMSGIVQLLAIADNHHCNMLTFYTESKETGLELVKSQACCLFLTEELVPMNQLPGA